MRTAFLSLAALAALTVGAGTADAQWRGGRVGFAAPYSRGYYSPYSSFYSPYSGYYSPYRSFGYGNSPYYGGYAAPARGFGLSIGNGYNFYPGYGYNTYPGYRYWW